MKIGWLVFDEDGTITFFTKDPYYHSGRLVQIVYTEVIDADP